MEEIKSKPLSSYIFIPLLSLIFLRPFFSGLAYPVFERCYELILIALAIAVFLKGASRVKTKINPIAIPIILLLSAYFISAISSINKTNAVSEVLKFSSFAFMFYLASKTSEKQENLIIKTIVISGIIISAYAIYQYLWGYANTIQYLKDINSDFLIKSSYARDILIAKRAIGTFPSPNIFGGYLAVIFFLMLYILSGQRPGIFIKILALLIILSALVLTKSMGAWLSLIAGAAFLLLSHKTIRHKKIILIAFIAVIFLISGFIIAARWERITNLENPQNSITQRLNYWRTAMAMIKTHPILGVGPGNFQDAFLQYKIGLSTDTRYAHNLLLHTWAETGILGIISLIYLLAAFLKKARSKSKYIILAGAVFLIHNLIDNTYLIPEASFLWWVLLALV